MTEDWVQGGGHSPVWVILLKNCHETSDYFFSTCLDQLCWDVVNSSWLPFLQWSHCSFPLFAKDGLVVLCVCLGTVQHCWISISLVITQLRAVFCQSVQYLSVFWKAFSWTVLDSSRFPLFYSGQVFHELVWPPAVALPRTFFQSHHNVLLSSFFFFAFFPFTSWCCCSSPCISQILQVRICSFSVVSFCRTDQEFLQWPRVFSSMTVFAKDLTGCWTEMEYILQGQNSNLIEQMCTYSECAQRKSERPKWSKQSWTH